MAESIHVSKLRNVTESSLPEILINRTSYLSPWDTGNFHAWMQGVREGRLHPPSLGEFWFLVSIIWSSWQQPRNGEMMSWSQAGRPVRRMFARSGGQHGLRKVPGSGTLNIVKRPTFHWHGKSKQLFEILKDSKLRGSREDLPPGEQLLRAVEDCEGESNLLVHCYYFIRAHPVLCASSGFICMPGQWEGRKTSQQTREGSEWRWNF